MRHFNYVLTPTRLNNAKPKDKPYKLVDGGGLFVLVSPGGAKNWKYQYPLGGKRCEVTIGRYPEIGVADARDRHAEYRAMVERGEDPAAHRREKKAERAIRAARDADEGQFKAFSLKWIDERLAGKTEGYRKQIRSRLDRFVWPAIGRKALDDVKPAHVLAIVEGLRATPNTAEGVRVVIQQCYDYAIQKLLAETNPARPLRGVITVPKAVHHRHLSESELGRFWVALSKQGAHLSTMGAARLLMYSMCRKNEVLRAKWTEFDFDKAQWDIPAERMKSRRPHRVFLSRQALEVLQLQRAISGGYEYVFPSPSIPTLPLADATLNHLFKRLDFGVPEFSPHGTRGTAATVLREHGFSRDVVELLLAHTERNQTAASYHHHELEAERRRALQYFADEIDRLAAIAAAGNVVDLRQGCLDAKTAA
ncbi:tyrosine-type recombinase/integrase [Ralstonia solanacearum]|uniref:tyrosine-type recombinase/integrase n=1 Tax=Ralstonia solanacearum TaxID=305 RepID=UPI00078E5CA6|nr:integrase arm-type DNA-binding domain-containing protein [Ralstonia solanacearum]AMP36820.1 integrase [Ralstonia solanacearum]AXV85625.1 integrase [Ralstonia solanacearum]AXW05134.1 integrase [Ralstonia solanacearum]AXW22878.1 integrase [Ralstonia solanacearum]AXW79825.1 integrase [Ralstonia solanacearum]